MIVDLRDGCCRSCGGKLEITDVSDATMFVVCTECADGYDVEHDAYGDGCMKYLIGFLADRFPEEDLP